MNTNAKIQIIKTTETSPSDPGVDQAINVMLIDGYVVSEVPLQLATQTMIYDDLIEGIVSDHSTFLSYKAGQLSSQLEESLQSLAERCLYIIVAMSVSGEANNRKIFRDVPLQKLNSEGSDYYLIGSLTSVGFAIWDDGFIAFTKNFMKANGFDNVTELNLSIIAYKNS